MSEEYLWNRSGEPDDEIMRLEAMLNPLSLNPKVASERRRKPLLMAAAAAVLLIGMGTIATIYTTRVTTPVTSWQLSLAGAKATSMRAGQIIETSNNAGGEIESTSVGEVRIEPASRLRLLTAAGNEQRLALDRGTIHALIWAPPAKFIVDTPSAHAVDLGCQYTLRVSKDGTGFLTVETGWVAFESHGAESFIPAGAACTTRPLRSPGIPYFLDAPNNLTVALEQFDATGKSAALEAALSAARPRDALTLWHLLGRTHGEQRAKVFDHLVVLVNLPPSINRQAILRGDRKSMDAAWDALDLGDTAWYREWSQKW